MSTPRRCAAFLCALTLAGCGLVPQSQLQMAPQAQQLEAKANLSFTQGTDYYGNPQVTITGDMSASVTLGKDYYGNPQVTVSGSLGAGTATKGKDYYGNEQVVTNGNVNFAHPAIMRALAMLGVTWVGAVSGNFTFTKGTDYYGNPQVTISGDAQETVVLGKDYYGNPQVTLAGSLGSGTATKGHDYYGHDQITLSGDGFDTAPVRHALTLLGVTWLESYVANNLANTPVLTRGH